MISQSNALKEDTLAGTPDSDSSDKDSAMEVDAVYNKSKAKKPLKKH